MKRTVGFLLATLTLAACGVAESPYERRYYPPSTYQPGDNSGGDPVGGDPTSGNCGNATVDLGEECDIALTLTQTCESLGFASGTLRCSAACQLDTSGCQTLETCNNGQLDTLEACEGFEMRGETCESQGFTGGTLRCSAACTLDTSQCTLCGNNILETGETCDGTHLGGKTCETEMGAGYVGELTCQSCSYLSTSGCSQAADRDQECNAMACRDPYSCDVVYAADNGSLSTCKLRCTQPGTSGGCPTGESCMRSGWLEAQDNTAIPCTTATDCDPGYDCIPSSQGDICAFEIAWCGTEVNWVTDYSSETAIQNGPVCNDIFGHAMCRDATGANPAMVRCVPLSDSGDGVCLALCDGEEGDLECGAGFQCTQPDTNLYYVAQDDGSGGYVYCSDATECDATGGFSCQELSPGMLCARPRRACMPQ